MSITTMAKSFNQMVSTNRHPRYYFEDGVVFRVEDTYFKIPRRKLCLHSPVFSGLFVLPVRSSESASAAAEGSSDEHPINLPQESAVDFERLLTYLYPLTNNYLSSSDNFSSNWDLDYLHSILKLSKKFIMDDTRAEIIKAINQRKLLNDMSMTKIQFGREFDNPPWTLEGLIELVKRQSPLSVDEGKILGLEDAIRCMAARETCRNASGPTQFHFGASTSDQGPKPEHVISALRKWFVDDHRLFGGSSTPVKILERGELKTGMPEGPAALSLKR